jgi:Fe-Mn family superoxide dismutase
MSADAEIETEDGRRPTMPHLIQRLPFKPHRLNGLSQRLLDSHYENNYGGAVRRLNAIDRHLADLDPARTPNFVLNGLKREQLIAANSAVLHEIYFAGLGGDGGDPDGDMAAALERDFGSVAGWRAEFAAMGKALAGGSGWVLLCWSPHLGRLVNQWAADHTHALAGADILLALDMYEHAYHLDFGADAGAYVDAVLRNLSWDHAEARFTQARGTGEAQDAAATLTVEALRDMLERGEPVAVLDVRLAEDYAAGRDTLPSATHLPPERLAAAVASLPCGVPVAAYCEYGFQVSREAVALLRAQGIDARVVRGGIAAWHAMGGRTVAKRAADAAA